MSSDHCNANQLPSNLKNGSLFSSRVFHKNPEVSQQQSARLAMLPKSGTKKGGFSKGGFRRNSQIFITLLFMYCMFCNMAPNVPTSDQPISLSIVSSKGCHVSWRQARYRTTCKLAEPKYSTAFDKNGKNSLVQEQGVSLCRLPCESRSATSFRQFPRISANFRQFPQLSAPFAGAVEGYPAIFRTISANSRSAVCTAWAWSHRAPWSLWCTVAVHQVKGVAVVLMSGQ